MMLLIILKMLGKGLCGSLYLRKSKKNSNPLCLKIHLHLKRYTTNSLRIYFLTLWEIFIPVIRGWYMGSGTFFAALAEFMASVMNSNLGGGHHAAPLVEEQVINSMKGWLEDFLIVQADCS